MNAKSVQACPECGAGACRSGFDRAMALELTDPAYGAVHHLTVSAFMVQHPSRLSAHGWAEEVKLLDAFLAGLTPEEARRRPSAAGRTSLTRGEPAPPANVRWSRTIDDVRFGQPDEYCRDIRAWAACVGGEVTTVAMEEDHR